RICEGVAPRAFLSPISFKRSERLTNIMLLIPTPPTRRATMATAVSRVENTLKNKFICAITFAFECELKLPVLPYRDLKYPSICLPLTSVSYPSRILSCTSRISEYQKFVTLFIHYVNGTNTCESG